MAQRQGEESDQIEGVFNKRFVRICRLATAADERRTAAKRRLWETCLWGEYRGNHHESNREWKSLVNSPFLSTASLRVVGQEGHTPLLWKMVVTVTVAVNPLAQGVTHTHTHSDIGFQLTQLPRWEGR